MSLKSRNINPSAFQRGAASNENKFSPPSGTLAEVQAFARTAGAVYYVTDRQRLYYDTGTALLEFGNFLADGTRAMTGDLNLATHNISGGGNVSAVNVSASSKSTTKVWTTTPSFTVTTTNGTLALNSASSTVQFITGSAAGFSVVMPNATTLDKGTNFEIYNRSSVAVLVKYFDGTLLGILDSESVSSLILQDNTTTNGVFSPFTVEIAQASGILNYNAQAQDAFVTSSTTDTQITSFTVVPAAGEYFISYNASNVSSTNNGECTVSLYKNGVQILGTERTARSTASNFILILSTQGVATFSGTDELRVYVRITTGTLTVNNRNVILLRLGG